MSLDPARIAAIRANIERLQALRKVQAETGGIFVRDIGKTINAIDWERDIPYLLDQIAQQAQEMQAWQPISTAPNDTTLLLATAEWVAVGRVDSNELGRFWTWHPPMLGQRGQEIPTHWQPLPLPPPVPGADQ